MANTTAIASGVKRYLAVPVSSSTGTNTMQMERVETSVGTAICEAPSSTCARTRRLRHAEVADAACSRFRPWHRLRGCRPRAPVHPASSH